jgi:hypothetical protein
MKPTEILRLYKNNISLVDACVLEVVIGFDAPVTVQKIVLKCCSDDIASPATIHKAIANLLASGLLRSSRTKGDNDRRKHWLEVTIAGERRAKDWA